MTVELFHQLLFDVVDHIVHGAQAIRDRVRAMDGNYYAVVTVEHSYTD